MRITTTDLDTYPVGTRIRIGSRRFTKTPAGSFWREEHHVPGNCVTRPAASLRSIEDAEGHAHIVIGYFVDWDGNTRRVEAPGNGYTCEIVRKSGRIDVDVVDPEGFVCHEAVYYPTIESLQAVGVTPTLVE